MHLVGDDFQHKLELRLRPKHVHPLVTQVFQCRCDVYLFGSCGFPREATEKERGGTGTGGRRKIQAVSVSRVSQGTHRAAAYLWTSGSRPCRSDSRSQSCQSRRCRSAEDPRQSSRGERESERMLACQKIHTLARTQAGKRVEARTQGTQGDARVREDVTG